MGDKSKIEWCDASWNPITGCSRVSEGCRNCYAEREAIRHQRHESYAGTARSTPAGPRWTGKVNTIAERLDLPLKWQRGRRIFRGYRRELDSKPTLRVGTFRIGGRRGPQHGLVLYWKEPVKAMRKDGLGMVRTPERERRSA